MRKVLFGIVLVGALAFAPQAFAKTLYVDKDKVQCPRADFTSIQAAVTAALPGDTIKVCPDLYNESVNVNKPALTLIGSTNANIDCSVLTAADPTTDSIVTAGAAASFTLNNNDITLSGFTVQGDTANAAIQTITGFSGYRITGNIVQNNVPFGINFVSDGQLGHQSRVDHNCLRLNQEGLASEGGNLFNALVDHNSSFRNSILGLDFSGAGQRQYVTVTSNSILNDGNGIGMTNSIGSSIDHNDPVRTTGSSILIGGANNNLAIGYNNVQSAGGDGIRIDVTQFIPQFLTPNAGLNVTYNSVTGATRNGIRVDPNSANLSLFSNNNTYANGLDGIILNVGNTNNRILNNDADKNGQDGIHAAGATGNTFEDNHMYLNVKFDAEDNSVSGNTWISNHCTTANPPTLCST